MRVVLHLSVTLPLVVAVACERGEEEAPAVEPSRTPGCPEDMVRIQGGEGSFCIHAYEIRLEGGVRYGGRLFSQPGTVPSNGASWVQARSFCEKAGLHLCTSQEWEDACDGQPGPGGRDHATPDGSYAPRQCAVAEHAIESEPWLMPSGSFSDCRTPEGVYDLMGNLWEWTDPQQEDEHGQPLTDKRGGAHYSQGPVRCDFGALGMHPPDFNGSIGFRCCLEAR